MFTRPAGPNRTAILFLLLAVSVVASVDRMAMSVMVEPIKAEFSFSDGEIGFLLGPAFVVLYALFGILFGLWSDRGNRRNIIAAAISLWSVLTIACGAAIGFFTLALTRMGVAVGEAGANPPAYSMISDLYDEHERTTAIGIFSTSSNIGILVGFAAAGLLSEALGWRFTFFILGAPGLLLGLIIYFFVKEPPRKVSLLETGDHVAPPFLTTFEHMWAQRTVRHLLAGGALTAFVGLGFSNWLPAFFERSFPEMDRGTINVGLGLVIGVVGGAGTFLGGYLSDRVAKRDIRWRLWIACIAIFLGWPIGLGSLFAGEYGVVLSLMALPAFVALFHVATLFALMQQLVEPRMRAVATAILMLFTNLLGGGLGPYYVGIVSDLLTDKYGEQALAWALTSLVFFAFWAAVHFFLASRHLLEDAAKSARSAEPGA
jgi:MFS family permease